MSGFSARRARADARRRSIGHPLQTLSCRRRDSGALLPGTDGVYSGSLTSLDAVGDAVMQGRTLELQDVWSILRRRRDILLPFALIALVSVTVVQLWPNKYRSETLIMVVPERVPPCTMTIG